MSSLRTALSRVAEDLTSLGASWAVIGGLAVSARAEPRFTRDVDLSIAVENDRQAEALVFALRGRGYGVLATVEQDAVKRFATARLSAPGETLVVVDLLFASSGIERETVQGAERVEVLDGLFMPVATVPYLLALKVLSVSPRRSKDADDIRVLCREATKGDLEAVDGLLDLIGQRGFARGKDLHAEWVHARVKSESD
jgi:predicted nucleotidyltransferase